MVTYTRIAHSQNCEPTDFLAAPIPFCSWVVELPEYTKSAVSVELYQCEHINFAWLKIVFQRFFTRYFYVMSNCTEHNIFEVLLWILLTKNEQRSPGYRWLGAGALRHSNCGGNSVGQKWENKRIVGREIRRRQNRFLWRHFALLRGWARRQDIFISRNLFCSNSQVMKSFGKRLHCRRPECSVSLVLAMLRGLLN